MQIDRLVKSRFRAHCRAFGRKALLRGALKNPGLFAGQSDHLFGFGATAHSFRKGFSKAKNPDFLLFYEVIRMISHRFRKNLSRAAGSGRRRGKPPAAVGFYESQGRSVHTGWKGREKLAAAVNGPGEFQR